MSKQQLEVIGGKVDFSVPLGAHGQLVKDFQKCFNREVNEGNFCSDLIDVDGLYGPQTHNAVHLANQKTCQGDVLRLATFEALRVPIRLFVDLSDHHFSIDFEGLKNLGFDCVYYKLTEGFDHKAKKADRLIEARDSGFSIGGYHFGRPDLHSKRDDAKIECANFVNMVEVLDSKGIELMLPHCYDFEKGNKNDEQHNVQYFETFIKELKKKTIVTEPLLYTAKWALQMYSTSDLFRIVDENNVQVWWAEYIRKFPLGGPSPQKYPALMKPALCWQFTASFSCDAVKRWDGERALVDVNLQWDTENVERQYC